ncbi:TonB-dependent receptor [Pseudomonas sp. TMW22090]|uniref:TonB-dependent siderophore receptor n=1 Tax=Pseudomonas sp. TMW22090 TaxID=2506434 RepID=UPI000F08F749|nr:TonB-dependent receptor [Pseudomonas sp. TMW22090]MCH4875874.1 TonB-dependent receptor [Pseudomonas sp. TMW22090]
MSRLPALPPLALLSMLAMSCWASDPAQNERIAHYAIVAQPLASALAQFARQNHLQLSFDAALAQGKMAPAVNGELNERQALAQLLSQSGVGWTVTDDRTLLLFPQPDSGALNLAPSTITANAFVERADGPVDGYRATRSATGTKTDTALRDIPQSIQVVSRQVLDDQQINNLGDALTNVSSVQRGNTHGGSSESFVIRGFKATTYAVDGMLINPLVSRPEALRDLANVERIEVLKGPASVLYGRGNPGGLINLVTRQPSFTPEAEVKAQAGTYDFYRLEANASGPLDEAGTLAGRMTVATQTDRGFRDTFRDSKRTYVAPTLRWEPTDSTRVDAGAEYIDQTSPFDRGLIPQNGKISMNADRYLHEPWSRDKAQKASVWFRAEHDVNDWLTLRQMTRWDQSHKDRYVVDLRTLGADGRTLSRRATDGDERIKTLDMQFEAIARFATGGLKHTVLAGFEYIDGKRNVASDRASLASIDIFNPVYGALPGAFAFNEETDYKVESYSLYLQDQIDLSEQWKLIVGARYDDTRQRNSAIDASYDVTRTNIDPSKVSPRLGLVYQPTDWLALYASYSTSFTPQSNIQRNGSVLDPEEGTQYEVGAKVDVIPDRLSATLSVFEITRENVAAPDPSDDNYSLQTGEQKVRGIELDVTGTPLEGWEIIGNISALDAKVTKDTAIDVGNRLDGVPIMSGSIWSSYQLQEGPMRGLGFGAGVIAVGERQGDIDNSYDVSGYARIDASVFYDINENVRISLNGRNLTDRKYIEVVAGTDGNYAGAPASAIAAVSVKF